MKKPILRKLIRVANNIRVHPFLDPVAILGPPGGHFRFCRRCSIAGGAALQAVSECPRHAGGERVPPAPLGWYVIFMLVKQKLTAGCCWTLFLTRWVFVPLMKSPQVSMNCQKFHSGAASTRRGAWRSSLILKLNGRNFQSFGARYLVDKVGNLINICL